MRHEDYMRMALKLAQKARGLTNPNPMVGCVIVKNGRIIAKRFHKKAGFGHAEIEAINQAGRNARGASLYVNLEPCRHYGRTPPCTKAIIESGVKEIYTSMIDPNPLNNGKGIEELRKNGIKVNLGILEDEARKVNEVFIKFVTKRMPFVVVKAAQSLDGKIATKTGESKWISSEKSRDYVRRLRAEVDAVMVGVNTIIKDDPLLNPKSEIRNSKQIPNPNFQIPNKKSFYKIILDPTLRIPENARVFSKESAGKVILVTTKQSSESRINLLRKKAEVIVMKAQNGQIDFRDLMRELAKREIIHVLIEGGGRTIAAALEARIVDKVLFFIAPKIIGGKDAVTSVEGKGIDRLKEAIRIKEMKIKRIGEDVLIEGKVK